MAAQSAPPDAVRLTWLSVTGWLVEAGDVRLLLDGYLTRIDRTMIEADGSSGGAAATDTARLRRLLAPALPGGRADWILAGHGHWDHAFDVPALARLTRARVAGSRTVCHQAATLGLEAARCTPVEGGESFDAGPGVRVRVVRWHHSGDGASDLGRRLRAPLELRGPPPPDPATGGLRPGFLEDYPNGGGARAYLITVATASGPVTLFWSNTGNPEAWDTPVPADSAFLREAGVDLSNLEWAVSDRPTRDELADALREEGLGGVDLWLGFPGPEHVRQVLPTLRARTFVPQHWDDFWSPIESGPGPAFSTAGVTPVLEEAGARIVVPTAYYDRFVLDARGLAPADAPDYVDGRAAGEAAARRAPADRGALRMAGGLVGGALVGASLPLGGIAGLALLGLAVAPGATDLGPPAPLADSARSIGPDYALGFGDGYRHQRRRNRTVPALVGAVAGFVVGALVAASLLGPG